MKVEITINDADCDAASPNPAAGGLAGSLASLTLTAGASSCVGPRPENEDAYRVETLDDGTVCVAVSDGIGGGPYGEVFSKVAVSRCIESLSHGSSTEEALLTAHRDCSRLRQEICPRRGGGATLVALRVDVQGNVECSWVGDSIAALIRPDGSVEQLATPDRVLGTNALASAICLPDTRVNTARPAEMHPGDIIVAATDGAWEYFEETGTSLARLIDRGISPLENAYIMAADAGRQGTDNATVALVFAEGK